MSRLIVFVLLGLVAYFFVKNLKRRSDVRGAKEKARPVERMVVCARCAVHVPKSEAVVYNGQYFCGEAHRRLGGR